MNISTLFWTIILGVSSLLILSLCIVEPELMQPQMSYSATQLGADFEIIQHDGLIEKEKINGLQVTKISEGRLKSETGIKEGFIVTKLNGMKIQSINKLQKTLRKVKVKGEVVIEGLYLGSNSEVKYVFNL